MKMTFTRFLLFDETAAVRYFVDKAISIERGTFAWDGVTTILRE